MKKIALLFFILLTFGCESLFFQPLSVLTYHPDLCKSGPQDILYKTDNNTTLHAWFIPAKSNTSKGTVFFLHGNAQNMSYHIHNILWLTEKGYNIFTFDYRGYGISNGEPDVKNVINDSIITFEKFIDNDLGKGKIIILGQSLGGAIAANLAAETRYKDKIDAVILDSAFSSWRKIYRNTAGRFAVTWLFQYPISWFITDDYAPVDAVSRIDKSKLLIIHNVKDKIVPQEHAKDLYNSNKNADFWLLDTGQHIEALNNQEIRFKLIKWMEN